MTVSCSIDLILLFDSMPSKRINLVLNELRKIVMLNKILYCSVFCCQTGFDVYKDRDQDFYFFCFCKLLSETLIAKTTL